MYGSLLDLGSLEADVEMSVAGPVEVGDLRALFDHIDTDGDGIVTSSEFRAAMTGKGNKQLRKSIKAFGHPWWAIYSLIDASESQQIEFTQLYEAVHTETEALRSSTSLRQSVLRVELSSLFVLPQQPARLYTVPPARIYTVQPARIYTVHPFRIYTVQPARFLYCAE